MSDNDDDLCIPRSAMYKLIKEIVPQVRLSGESKDLIANACNEFIHLLATEANNVCEKQSKKLILPDHVLAALDNLGFSEYKEDCVDVMKQMQVEVDKRKKLRHRLERPDIPEAELLRQQNLLFAEARQQQQMIETAEEWSKMQMEAQLALQRQASLSMAAAAAATSNSNDNSGTSHLSNSSNGEAITTPTVAPSSEFTYQSQASFRSTSITNNNDDDNNYD